MSAAEGEDSRPIQTQWGQNSRLVTKSQNRLHGTSYIISLRRRENVNSVIAPKIFLVS